MAFSLCHKCRDPRSKKGHDQIKIFKAVLSRAIRAAVKADILLLLQAVEMYQTVVQFGAFVMM